MKSDDSWLEKDCEEDKTPKNIWKLQNDGESCFEFFSPEMEQGDLSWNGTALNFWISLEFQIEK